MSKKNAPLPYTLDEVILTCDRAGMTDAEIYRRAFVVVEYRGSLDAITRRRLELRADLVRMWLADTIAVAEVNREDLETLRDVREALYWKATGKDPMTLQQNRTPSEAAARELREVIAMRRSILKIDEPGRGGAGGANVTFTVMEPHEVEAARAKSAEHDAIDAEFSPAQLEAAVVEQEEPPQLTGDPALDAARKQHGMR